MGDVAHMINPSVARIRSALRNAADASPCMELAQLIKGWLSEGGASVLYGPSNAGKTFVALSIAAHVASGRDWFGNSVRKASVLYLALEGGKSFDNRVAAIRQQLPELLETRGLIYASVPIDLYGFEGFQHLCDAMPDEDFGLIVIDTLARAMAGADENTARDMGQMIGHIDRLRELTGAHVMVVHHSGKDASAGARGSSALRAAVDTELALSFEGQLSVEKQRDMARAEPLYVDLQSVEFGTNSDGDLISSAVAIQANAPKAEVRPLTGQADVAMQALYEALRSRGETRRGEDWPSTVAVALDAWRDECVRKGIVDRGATNSTQRKAFNRAKDKLIELNRVRIQDDHAWAIGHD